MIELTFREGVKLRRSLRSAFRSRSALAQVVFDHLREDLGQLTGAVRGVGAEPKILFHNQGDKLVNVAAALGVLNLEGRTRMPLWVDLDGDGRLDLFHGAEARLDDKNPPFVFVQGKNAFDALRAALPVGTVSGAPKVRAMQIIADLEASPRGLYAGAVGYCGFDDLLEFAIAIRTVRSSRTFISTS